VKHRDGQERFSLINYALDLKIDEQTLKEEREFIESRTRALFRDIDRLKEEKRTGKKLNPLDEELLNNYDDLVRWKEEDMKR
jgi:hypothetical protein